MRVLTFGEILLRLSSPGHTKLLQKDSLDATFCGSEANVAVSLSKFGIDTKFLTKLPNSEIGNAAINSMRYFGVNTDKVIYGTGRMGLFYLEKGASQRPSKVIYDREYSAIAEAKPNEFNWKAIFQDIDWFHFSGITPALSKNMMETCLDACKYAHNTGITISCDLNFRAKLWSSEKAQQTMKELVKYVDICILIQFFCIRTSVNAKVVVILQRNDIQYLKVVSSKWPNYHTHKSDKIECLKWQRLVK